MVVIDPSQAPQLLGAGWQRRDRRARRERLDHHGALGPHRGDEGQSVALRRDDDILQRRQPPIGLQRRGAGHPCPACETDGR